MLLFPLVLFSPADIQAQAALSDEDRAALEQTYDKAFKDVFADPGDLDKSFAFAKIAIQMGNFEAAISALERMLLVNPNLPRVRLELGVLYFRLESYQLAQTYLERAVAGEDVPDQVRARVATFLEEIENRSSNHQISGNLFSGLRWQSNANAGPSSSDVLASGNNATLSDQFTAKNDSNIFISGSVKHVYDFQRQDGATLESNGIGYASQQRTQGTVDLVYVEGNTGPRLMIDNIFLGKLNVRPYGVGNVVGLADARYMIAYGGGVELGLTFAERFLTDVKIQHKERRFRDSEVRTTNSRNNGGESLFKLGGKYALSGNEVIGLSLTAKSTTATDHYNGSTEALIEANYTFVVKVPYLPKDFGPMTGSLSGSRTMARYKGYDPDVDPNNRRHDRHWSVGLMASVPIGTDWSVVLNLQKIWADSSLANFQYQNKIATLGLSFKF